MINDSLELIGHNLLEIYDAVVTLPDQPINLVAWENKIYSVHTSWVGRRIVFFNSIIKIFKCNSEKEQVKLAIQKTHQLFEDYKSRLRDHILETESALSKWKNGDQENLSHFQKSFQQVLTFQEASWPFLKLIIHQNPKLKTLLSQCLPFEHTSFHDVEFVNRIKRLSQIFRLVVHSGGSLPRKAFIKALGVRELPEEDKEDIEHWVQEMKLLKGTINNRLVGKGLLALVDFFNHGRMHYHAEDIEEYLLRFYDDYRLPDPKHIAWRQSLDLGQQICPKAEGFDNTIAFMQLDGNVQIIAQNRAALRIQNHMRKNRSNALYGPKPCQYIYVDPKGRFAVAPFLRPIQNPEPLIGLTEWLVRQPTTPTDLKFEYLALDPKGLLVSVKNHERDKTFNYNSIEELVYAFVKNNIALYQRIIKQSRLMDLPQAFYFRDCILKGFYQENIDAIRLVQFYDDHSALRKNITDKEDINHAKKLYQQARQIALETRQELISLEVRHDPARVEAIWKEEVKKWWNSHCLAGRLWSNFKVDLTDIMGNRLRECSQSLT